MIRANLPRNDKPTKMIRQALHTKIMEQNVCTGMPHKTRLDRVEAEEKEPYMVGILRVVVVGDEITP